MISKWETLSKTAAKERVEIWNNLPAEGFEHLALSWSRHEIDDCPFAYQGVRDKLVNAYKQINEEVDNDQSISSASRVYQKEYRFALVLFETLNAEGLTLRNASDDGVWRFLSMIVLPDIVYHRWKRPDPRFINADRFYLGTRRIWFKVLWWYVYLCWQGSLDETAKLIATNNADEISQLVERAGTGGYRVELYRQIMFYYDTNISQKRRAEEKNLLSRILQLNIARSQIIEPDLVPGGTAAYVKQLFEYFGF